MKVYPVGARILPKTASAGSTGAAASGSPVFMVATSASGLIQRVGQKAAQTVTLTSGQRVVTVNTASLRPGVQQGLKTSSVITASAIKTLQPRVVSSSGQVNKVSKPSVIVVQRSQTGATKALMTKDVSGIPGATITGSTVTTTRILQTKPAKQPIVIVSKNSGNNVIASENAAATVSSTHATTTPNQVRKNNVCLFTQCLKITQKVSLYNIASEASYVYLNSLFSARNLAHCVQFVIVFIDRSNLGRVKNEIDMTNLRPESVQFSFVFPECDCAGFE